MSDYDLDSVHEQSSAILEKLYNEKGEPEELDEAFIQEYFNLVQDSLKLPVGAGNAPQPSDAKLHEHTRGLIEVFEHSSMKKFVVSRLNAGKLKRYPSETCPTNWELVKIIPGSSRNYGPNQGKGRYRMSMVVLGGLKVPRITIKSESGGVVVVSHTPFQLYRDRLT